MNDILPVVSQIQVGLKSASQAALTLFESSSLLIERSSFSRSKMGDKGVGSVYIYYNEYEKPIYVGQTGRYVKSRLYDQTSPHRRKEWWNTWVEMRFLPMQSEQDRLVLEFLLIIACSPSVNLKPGSIRLEDLFAHSRTVNES